MRIKALPGKNRGPTEAQVLRDCLELLKVRGVFAWRASQSGVRRKDARGREFYAFHGLRGVSDILAILPPNGRLLAIECKRPGVKIRLSREQLNFLNKGVQANGGAAIVVDSTAMLDNYLKHLGVWA